MGVLMFENVKPIGITTRAAEEVKKIMQTKSIPSDYGLRVGVRGGGCGGMALIIGFDKQKPTDLSYTVYDIQVYVDKKHTMYLIGKEVDFYEGADARGFMFKEVD
jgi:iron-sulfur cluster assembly protein